MMPIAKKKAITLRQTPKMHMSVFADRDKIKQLVLILLDNAMKYTYKDGKVTVSLTNKSRPLITITDTGIGMTEQEKKHIFERFFRADKSRTQGGSGLGLSIAKWIADAHHIQILCKTKKNSGTTFALIFQTK